LTASLPPLLTATVATVVEPAAVVVIGRDGDGVSSLRHGVFFFCKTSSMLMMMVPQTTTDQAAASTIDVNHSTNGVNSSVNNDIQSATLLTTTDFVSGHCLQALGFISVN